MKKKYSAFLTAGCLSILIFSLSCQKEKALWKGKIEKENGVMVVKNPDEPISKDNILFLEEDLTIKGGDIENEERMFRDVRTLDVDEAGNIYVLDEAAGNVKIFDKNGEFLRSFGKKGQGPGETQLPISLVITPQREILINDMFRRALLFFDLEGRYLRQVSIADQFLFFGPMMTSRGEMIACRTIPGEAPVTELVKLTADLKPLVTYASIPGEKPPAINIFTAQSLTNLRWIVTPEDEIIWNDTANPKYELNICRGDGKLIKKIIREYSAVALTSAERDKLMDKVFKDPEARQQWDVKFPNSYPPISGLSCDDEGRIFAKRYSAVGREEAGEYYDIFDEQGRYIAEILLQIAPMVMKKGNLYTIVEDEAGLKAVKRYKMNWTPGPVGKIS